MSSIHDNIDHFIEPEPHQTLDEYLDNAEERWNQRIDRDVKVLGDGLEKIIQTLDSGLADYSNPHTTDLSSLTLSTHTSSMVLAAENLLALTHQLKLMVLLSDDQGVKKSLDAQQQEVERDLTAARDQVAERLKEQEDRG